MALTLTDFDVGDATLEHFRTPLDDTDDIPPYLDGVSRAGFWGQLSKAHLSALTEIEAWCATENIDMHAFSIHALHPKLTILRFLRAAKYNIEKTKTAILAGVAWREKVEMASLQSCFGHEVLEHNFYEVLRINEHWHYGFDKMNRPIFYRKYGTFDSTELLKMTTMDNVEKYFAWEQEIHMMLCRIISEQTGTLIEHTSTVIDLEGMRMSQVTSDFMTIVRLSADVSKVNYPETLGKMYIINAPMVFPMVWRLVKVFLDPDVASKIEILGSKSRWFPVLENYFGIENIPQEYGGMGPPLDCTNHSYPDFEKLLKRMRGVPETCGSVDQEERATVLSNEDGVDVQVPLTDFSGVSLPGIELSMMPEKKDTSINDYTDEDSSDDDLDEVRERGVTLSSLLSDLQSFWTSETTQEDRPRKSPQAIRMTLHDHDDSESESVESHMFSDAFDTPDNCVEMDYTDKQLANGENNAAESVYTSWRLVIVKSFLRGDCMWKEMSTGDVKSLLFKTIIGAIVFGLGAMAYATYVVSSPYWLKVRALSIWSNIVGFFVFSLLVTVNFVGYMGLRTNNTMMLSNYGYCMMFTSVLCLAIAIISFVYMGLFIQKGDTSDYNISVSELNMGTAIFASFLFVGSYFPMSLTFTLSERDKNTLDKSELEQQIRLILWLANVISLFACTVMIICGSSSLGFLSMSDGTAYYLSVYGLIYGGVCILISSLFGLWAASTAHRSVVKFYYQVILPFVILVVSGAAASAVITAATSNESRWNIFLTFTAIYLIFIGIFQVIAFANARSREILMAAIRKKLSLVTGSTEGDTSIYFGLDMLSESDFTNNNEEELLEGIGLANKNHLVRRRNRVDRLLILYASLMGLFDVFYSLSYLIYVKIVNNDGNADWFGSLFRVLGRGDSRYTEVNGFFVALTAVYGILLGPLLLFYAWSTFVGAYWRHILGASICSVVVFSQIINYSIVIFEDDKNNYYKDSRPGELTLVLVPTLLFSVIAPSLIIYREFMEASNNTRRSQNIALFLDAKKMLQEQEDSAEKVASPTAAAIRSISKHDVARFGLRSRFKNSTDSLNNLESLEMGYSYKNTSQLSNLSTISETYTKSTSEIAGIQEQDGSDKVSKMRRVMGNRSRVHSSDSVTGSVDSGTTTQTGTHTHLGHTTYAEMQYYQNKSKSYHDIASKEEAAAFLNTLAKVEQSANDPMSI
jgi:hypothetical protein